MPRITSSVGDGGKNDRHDVSAIQVTISHIRVQTNFGMKDLYQGMIDGLNSPELVKSIRMTQQCAGEPVTGIIRPYTPILSKMNRMGIPISLIGLEGIKGTTAVFVPDIPPSEIETQARSEITRVELKSPLPTKLAASLSQVIRRINMKTKLYLVLKEVTISPQGRFEARLRFELAGFVSPMTRRLILSQPDYAPPEVIGLVCEQIESAGGWNVGSDESLIFQSTQSYASLTNRKEPTAAELKSIGLSQCPSDKLLKAMVQGCINLANTGVLGTSIGDIEHAALSGAALRINQTVGASLQTMNIQFRDAPRKWPTDHLLVTDKFGVQRKTGPHNGVDIRARLGESVYAVLAGEVIEVGQAPGGINQLIITYFDGSTGGYAHVKAFVSVGDQVIAGQAVGVSDGSGTLHPHLHYTFRTKSSGPNGRTVNPVDPQYKHLSEFPFRFKNP